MSFEVHKVQRRGHQQRAERLEARFTPTWTGQPDPTVTVLPNSAPAPAPSSATPVAPSPKPVSSSPVIPAAPVTPSSSAAAAAVPASSSVVVPPVVSSASSSSSLVSSSSPPSSSSSSVVQKTPVVVSTPSSSAVVVATPTTFRSLPDTTFTPTAASSASAAATSAASSGMSTGSIVGIAAAGVAGVAVVGAVGIWLLKRYFTSRDDDNSEPTFQRHSWMRNSVALPDDVPSPLARGPSINPRPPTMIERKQTQNYANVGPSRGGYPQDNVGIAYPGYQDSPYGPPPMPSFNPGQHYGAPSPNATQPFFSPISSPPPPSPGMASFDDTMPPMQHASFGVAGGAPVYFSRHDSNMSAANPDSAALPVTPNPHDSVDNDGYATLDRSSVTPYQAQQYAEISKQLHQEQALAAVAEAAAASPAQAYVAHGQGPSPFEDPAHASAPQDQYQELTLPAQAHPRVDSTPPTLPPMRAMSPVGAVGGAQASFAQLASAFPAAPMSPMHHAFPAPVASPGSPKSPGFKQAPPLSPAPGAQRQLVNIPEGVHVGRETPVQFGFNQPAAAASAPAMSASAKRMSVASKKSAKGGRPETMYDEEDAYGGI